MLLVIGTVPIPDTVAISPIVCWRGVHTSQIAPYRIVVYEKPPLPYFICKLTLDSWLQLQ